METKYIAFTFDDGPNLTVTTDILDILEKEEVKASFFIIGQNVDDNSVKVMQRAFDMGCEIACHSYSHPGMPQLSKEEIYEEVVRTNEIIEKATGKKPTFFRPPYIAVNEDMFDVISGKLGMTFICGKGCDDWNPDVPVKVRIDSVIRDAENGVIILLHDMPVNFKTRDALKEIIPALKAKGFKFVTVSQLFDKCGAEKDGKKLYSNVFQKSRFPWGDSF